MLPNEYQKLAARTLLDRPGFEITDRDIMLVWNAVGLAGETGELIEILGGIAGRRMSDLARKDKSGISKEIGDCYWYAAAICTKINVDFSDIVSTNAKGYDLTQKFYVAQLAGSMGAIVEHIKKGVFHQHGVDTLKLSLFMRDYTFALAGVCRSQGLEVEPIWTENIDKLKKRYPDGFKAEDSIKRVDVANQ